MERTLSIIKPDATKRNISGRINQIIEENDLRIIAQKRIKLLLKDYENNIIDKYKAKKRILF